METLTKDAADLFRIAVHVAGFDAGEVMAEIHRLQKGRTAKASVPTVERALQHLAERAKSHL